MLDFLWYVDMGNAGPEFCTAPWTRPKTLQIGKWSWESKARKVNKIQKKTNHAATVFKNKSELDSQKHFTSWAAQNIKCSTQ